VNKITENYKLEFPSYRRPRLTDLYFEISGFQKRFWATTRLHSVFILQMEIKLTYLNNLEAESGVPVSTTNTQRTRLLLTSLAELSFTVAGAASCGPVTAGKQRDPWC